LLFVVVLCFFGGGSGGGGGAGVWKKVVKQLFHPQFDVDMVQIKIYRKIELNKRIDQETRFR